MDRIALEIILHKLGYDKDEEIVLTIDELLTIIEEDK